MKTGTVKGNMKDIGESLKTRRKEMNLSLKEIESATSIRVNYLNAIEEGDMNKLISSTYAQGFVKQYAIFLGLDGERIVRENKECFNRPNTQEFAYGLGTIEMRNNPGSGVKWIPNAVWVAAFAAVLALAWGLAKFLEII